MGRRTRMYICPARLASRKVNPPLAASSTRSLASSNPSSRESAELRATVVVHVRPAAAHGALQRLGPAGRCQELQLLPPGRAGASAVAGAGGARRSSSPRRSRCPRGGGQGRVSVRPGIPGFGSQGVLAVRAAAAGARRRRPRGDDLLPRGGGCGLDGVWRAAADAGRPEARGTQPTAQTKQEEPAEEGGVRGAGGRRRRGLRPVGVAQVRPKAHQGLALSPGVLQVQQHEGVHGPEDGGAEPGQAWGARRHLHGRALPPRADAAQRARRNHAPQDRRRRGPPDVAAQEP